MTNTLKTVLISAMIAALSSTAIAQTATETEAEAETEAPQSEDRADGLSTGVNAPLESGSTYVRSVHGDWELRCIKAPEGQKDPCQLYQLLRDQNNNSVAEINLFSLPSDDKLAAGATIVTPLKTLLTRNVLLAVDGGKAKVYPFTFCTAIGCFSRVGFTSDDITSFKRGNAAQIVVIPAEAPTQKVELTVSLTGFTDGFNAVVEANKP